MNNGDNRIDFYRILTSTLRNVLAMLYNMLLGIQWKVILGVTYTCTFGITGKNGRM